MDGQDTYPNQMRNSDPRLINFKMPIKTKGNKIMWQITDWHFRQ